MKFRYPGRARLNSATRTRIHEAQERTAAAEAEKNAPSAHGPESAGWHQMNRKQRREMARKIQADDLSLQVVPPHAAGIDIGNESHYVAVPSTRDEQPVCGVSAAPPPS